MELCKTAFSFTIMSMGASPQRQKQTDLILESWSGLLMTLAFDNLNLLTFDVKTIDEDK